jgi:hypothetical protein
LRRHSNRLTVDVGELRRRVAQSLSPIRVRTPRRCVEDELQARGVTEALIRGTAAAARYSKLASYIQSCPTSERSSSVDLGGVEYLRKFAIGAICATLLVTIVWGSAIDLRLAAKAERNATPADIVTASASASECVPSPAMVLSYPGCASKPYRTGLYYTARMESLAQN